MTEIRATNAQLVQPIRSFETNLATFFGNQPVQIQIPELNVTSVETTVAIPVVWNDDDGLLAFDQRILDVDTDARLVLSEQIRHSILQVTHT